MQMPDGLICSAFTKSTTNVHGTLPLFSGLSRWDCFEGLPGAFLFGNIGAPLASHCCHFPGSIVMVSWRRYFPFISIPFLGLSAVFLQDSLSQGLASRSVAKSWIQVPGRILSKKVAVISSKSKNESKQATYRPSVTY